MQISMWFVGLEPYPSVGWLGRVLFVFEKYRSWRLSWRHAFTVSPAVNGTPLSPQHHWHLWIVFLMKAALTGRKWNLKVVLIYISLVATVMNIFWLFIWLFTSLLWELSIQLICSFCYTVSSNPGRPQTHCVANLVPEFPNLLPSPSRCWDYKFVPWTQLTRYMA